MYSNDKIKTLRDSFCEFIFDTGEILRLEEQSEVSLKANRQISIFVSIGKSLMNIDFKTANKKFNVYTPTSILGIRGTEFVVEVIDKSVTEVAVFSGKVSVKSSDTKEEVLVPAKKQTFVEKNKPPVEPFALTEKVIKYYETQVLAFQKRAEEIRKKLDEYIEKRNKMIDEWYKNREKKIDDWYEQR